MASNACWGVEVGSGGLKAIKLTREGDNVTVADFAIIPHKRPLSAPETDERDAKRLAVGQLVAQHDLSKAKLAISVGGNSGFARFAKLPPVEPKKVPEIVKFEAVQQIPFPIDDVQWDYQTFVQAGSPDIEVGIFAITNERVDEKLAKWQDVGRTPDVLTLSPLAAYNALAFDLGFTENMPGTVILDVGTVSTDLIVAEGGRMWIRTFPIGGHQFTEALVTAFNLSYPKAEKLKKDAETSQHARHILQAMRPVFGDLAQDVQRSIGYYQSLHKDVKLTRIIGLGATFQLPGLRKFLSQQLGMEVVKLESFNRIKISGERNAAFQASAGELATAYGLALQGLGLETINADLVPIKVLREALWREKTKYFVGAAVLALVAGGATFIGPLRDKFAKPEWPSSIASAKTTAASLKKTWTDVEADDKPDPRASATLGMLERRDIYGFVTDDIGQMMASAQTASGKDKLIFNRVSTTFQTSVSSSESAPSTGPSGGLLGGRGGGPEPVAVDTSAADSKPRLRVILDITTTKKDQAADELVQSAFVDWLKKHADRKDFPYTIETEPGLAPRFLPPIKNTVASTGNPGAPGGAMPPPPGGGGGRPAGLGGPGGRGGAIGEGGGGRGGQQGPAVGAPTGGAEQVNQIAPIPVQPPPAPPGSTLTTYSIVWDVVLRTGEVKKEGGQ